MVCRGMMRGNAARAACGAEAALRVRRGGVGRSCIARTFAALAFVALSACQSGSAPAPVGGSDGVAGRARSGTATAPVGVAVAPSGEPVRRIAPGDLRSGNTFTSPEVRTQEQDEFANPGMLWVERGTRLFREPAGESKQACSGCHTSTQRTMRGVAARHPAIDPKSGKLFNLADRIIACRVTHQRAPQPEWESEELLGLTAFVMRESRGIPINASIDGAARRHFEAGRALYEQRSGQMNLACTHCHDQLWGKTLFNERISQGHPNAFPIYRLNWQTAGSIERRLRACYSGIRAEMMPYGAPEHRDLELYLAWRAQGLPIESPGVRR